VVVIYLMKEDSTPLVVEVLGATNLQYLEKHLDLILLFYLHYPSYLEGNTQ